MHPIDPMPYQKYTGVPVSASSYVTVPAPGAVRACRWCWELARHDGRRNWIHLEGGYPCRTYQGTRPTFADPPPVSDGRLLPPRQFPLHVPRPQNTAACLSCIWEYEGPNRHTAAEEHTRLTGHLVAPSPWPPLDPSGVPEARTGTHS